MMAQSPAGPTVRNEERIAALERDLTKLETIVERLVAGMDAERIAMKESRQEFWSALKDLGDKMERSVSGLAAEIKILAEKNATADSHVVARQFQWAGAVDALKWVVGTGLVVASIFVAYSAGRQGERFHEYQGPHHQMRPAQ